MWPATPADLSWSEFELRDEAGNATATPVLGEYRDGVWIDLPISAALGDQVFLYRVVVADNGARLATGTYFDGAATVPFALAPDAAGVWNQVEIGAAPGFRLVDVEATSYGVQLITQEADDWVMYTSSDSQTFERVLLAFDDPDVTIIGSVESEGRNFLVGTVDVLAFSTFAVWESLPGGVVERIALDDAPAAVDLDVTDVIMDGDSLLAGIVSRNTSAVVTLDARDLTTPV
jgi:hypothetical protein